MNDEEIKKLRNDLIKAIRKNNFQEVKECVEKATRDQDKFALLNPKLNMNTEPVLYCGIRSKNLDIVKFLVNNGANKYSKDFFNNTPAFVAVENSTPEILTFLLGDTKDINSVVSFVGGINTISTMVNNEYLYDEEYITPLNLAVENGDLEKAKILIDYGANVNRACANGETYLHIATKKNNPEMVKLLIENSAQVNTQNSYDDTPLHIAVRSNFPKIIKLLYENRADVDIENKSGTSPESLAKYRYNKTVLEMSQESKDININSDNPTEIISTATSSATRPSFFINNLVNWIVHSSANAVVSAFHSVTDSPSTHQQTVDYADKSFSQDNVSGAIQLIDLAIRTYTREKYSGLSNEIPLTKEQTLENKIASAESNLKIAQGKYEKMNQCPTNSLNDTQVSKVKTYEKSL